MASPSRRIQNLRAAASLMALAALAGCNAHSAAPKCNTVPVAIATASKGAQATTLTGLGHVQGLDTALVRAQTSGPITAVDFVEGRTVSAGQPLAQIDPRPLQAALAQDEAALARDRAALANANDSLSRSAPLVSQGLASAQQVEGYKAQVAQFAAAVAGDRATIERDRLTLGYTTIRAPISGVTGVRNIDVGNLVSPTDPAGIVTIAQIQPIAVTFTLPQSEIAGVRAAMAAAGKAGLAVDALAQGGGQTIDRGTLLVINNQVDDGSGTVTLKAVFPNAAKLLWPGEFVTARLTLGEQADAVTVPASAIQSNPQGNYVWTVDAGGVARMRPVVTGARIGDRIVIARGLSGGEKVVTDGQFALSNGAHVAATGANAQQPLKADAPDQLGLQP